MTRLHASSLEQPYEYDDLEPGSQTFRLLSVSRTGTPTNQYQLDVVPLSNCPPYVALSYMWGPSHPIHTISVNGKLLAVRRNLWTVLDILDVHGLPSLIDGAPKFIWVDAICINQANLQERNHQVSMMRDIFSKACCTLAWIGNRDSCSDAVLDAVSHPQLWSSVKLGLGPYPVRSSLLGREYWHRVWIAQEILLARDVVVMCGLKSCRASELHDMIKFLAQSKYTLIQSSGAGTIFWAAALRGSKFLYPQMASEVALSDSTSKRTITLDELIIVFRRQRCSDVRDKIFGLLSLEQNIPQGVKPVSADYEQNELDVFDMVVRYLISLKGLPSTDVEQRQLTLLDVAYSLDIEPSSVRDNVNVQKFLGQRPPVATESDLHPQHEMTSPWIQPNEMHRLFWQQGEEDISPDATS